MLWQVAQGRVQGLLSQLQLLEATLQEERAAHVEESAATAASHAAQLESMHFSAVLCCAACGGLCCSCVIFSQPNPASWYV